MDAEKLIAIRSSLVTWGAVQGGHIIGLIDAILADDPTTPPTKYVLAKDYESFLVWCAAEPAGGTAEYLDGHPRLGGRIAPGCLIKLDGWHENPAYTIPFRRSLLDCAPPEDWAQEDIRMGLE